MATFSRQFEAIGTGWFIEFEADIADAAAIWQTIDERIESFDKAYSRFRDDSLVTKISKYAGTYTFPDDALPMMTLYKELYNLSSGAFTPLIGDTLIGAGYDASYSLRPKPLTVPPAWGEALTYTHPTLVVHVPVTLDFGAAGKGYLIDIIADILKKGGAHSFVIDAGGDIALHNTPATIGLEDPRDTAKAIGSVDLNNRSICGSAGNRRAWATYHHIIDPHSLQSPKNIEAVWVIADSTMLADALATALYFVPASVLQERYAFEYLILRPDYTVEQSNQFSGRLFT